jgi:hypothetical protein
MPCSSLSANWHATCFKAGFLLNLFFRPWRWRRRSSETSVGTQRTTRRYIPEDCTLHKYRCENLKSLIYINWITFIWVSGLGNLFTVEVIWRRVRWDNFGQWTTEDWDGSGHMLHECIFCHVLPFILILNYPPNRHFCFDISTSLVQNLVLEVSVPPPLSMWFQSSSLLHMGQIPCSLFLTPSVSRLVFSTILFLSWLHVYVVLHITPSPSCSLNCYTLVRFSFSHCSFNWKWQRR